MEKENTQNTTMAESVIDLITPEKVIPSVPETIELLSVSSGEDLTALFDKTVPLPTNEVVIIDSNDGAEESSADDSDDSSLGMGNSYGFFSPLYDMKKSIARHGYIDYRCEGSNDSLSCDSWYVDHCWWLEIPKTSVTPFSWIPPASGSCTKEKVGALALPRAIVVGLNTKTCSGYSGAIQQVQKFS